MTNIEFLRLAQSRIHDQADELARVNGSSRDRSLDDIRYIAGMVQGLLLSTSLMEEALRTAADDPDDE